MARFHGNIFLIYLPWRNFRSDCKVFAREDLRKIFVNFSGNFSRTIVRGENDRGLMLHNNRSNDPHKSG